MRARILDAALVILTLCAITVTGLVIRREFFAPVPQAQSQAPTREPGWRAYAAEGHRMGPAKAPVTIVVFSDFQCPFCGVLMQRLHEVRSAHPSDVAVVYRHFPLPNHRHAIAAARASECAAAQGKFVEYHDALFSKQDSIGTTGWDRYATVAGIPDLARFDACAADSAALPTLARDTVAGNRLRISGTPTVLINDMRFGGAVSKDTLDAYVRRILRASAPRS